MTETGPAVSMLLSVHVPGEPVSLHVLQAGERDLVLGRSADSDLPIGHPSVSRRHACLQHRHGTWRIVDLGSTNGLRINGNRLTEHVLADGDWLSLGDVFCQFRKISQPELEAVSTRAEQQRQTSGIWLGRLQHEPDRDALLAGVIAAIVQIAQCQRGFLLANNEQGRFISIASCGAQAGMADPFSGSTAVLDRAVHEQLPILLGDPSVLDWARGRPSVIAQQLRAVLAVPLLHQERLLGVAYADSDEPGKQFTELDRDILGAFASQAALLLAARGLDLALADLVHCVEVDRDGGGLRPSVATVWSAAGS